MVSSTGTTNLRLGPDTIVVTSSNYTSYLGGGGGGTTYARLTNSAHASGTDYVVQGSGYSGTGNGSKFLREDGTWQTVSGGGSTTLSGLTDVSISSPSNGQVLKYNGSKWVNGADNTGTSYTTLSASAHSSSTSYVIKGSGYSGTASKFLREDGTWQTVSGGGSTTLSGLTDTTISSPSNGQYLKYNGSKWVNAAAPGGASQATSWAESGSGTMGISIPTLSVNKAAFASAGASVANLPVALYYPGSDQYYALPVVID